MATKFVLIIASFSLFLSLEASSSDTVPVSDAETIRKIRAEYRERATAIRTIRIKFHHPVNPNHGGVNEPKRYEWLVSGAKQRLTQEAWKDHFAARESPDSPNSKLPPQSSWESFDGKTGYQVIYWLNKPDQISKIFESKSLPNEVRGNWLPVHFGILLPYSQIRLVDHLERPETVVLGSEAVSDARCVKLRLATYEPTAGSKHDVTVWLDEEHDFLLRRIAVDPVRLRDAVTGTAEDPIELEEKEISFAGITSSVISVRDPLSSRMRWFAGSFSTHTFIDEIIINEAIDPREFTPTPTVGAEIIKMDANYASYIVGGDEGLAVHREMMQSERIDDTATHQLAAMPTTPRIVQNWNATPPTENWLGSSMWILAVACFISSICFVLYRRRA